KNLPPRRQNVDQLHFLVRFDKDAKPVVFPPRDEPFASPALGPAGRGEDTFETKTPIEIKDLEAGDLRGVFSVEQILTWETAAVKRIDVVTIGAAANGDSAVSHRHAWRTLVPYKKKPVPKDEPKVDDPNKGAPDGGKGGVPRGAGGRPNK